MKHPPTNGGLVLNEDCTQALTRIVQKVSPAQSHVPLGELVRCARTLKDHQVRIDFTFTRRVGAPVIFVNASSQGRATNLFGLLTKREQEVSRLIVQGFTNAQIARRLRISLGTVKDHLHHVLAKTRMESRTALAAALAREGI